MAELVPALPRRTEVPFPRKRLLTCLTVAELVVGLAMVGLGAAACGLAPVQLEPDNLGECGWGAGVWLGGLEVGLTAATLALLRRSRRPKRFFAAQLAQWAGLLLAAVAIAIASVAVGDAANHHHHDASDAANHHKGNASTSSTATTTKVAVEATTPGQPTSSPQRNSTKYIVTITDGDDNSRGHGKTVDQSNVDQQSVSIGMDCAVILLSFILAVLCAIVAVCLRQHLAELRQLPPARFQRAEELPPPPVPRRSESLRELRPDVCPEPSTSLAPPPASHSRAPSSFSPAPASLAHGPDAYLRPDSLTVPEEPPEPPGHGAEEAAPAPPPPPRDYWPQPQSHMSLKRRAEASSDGSSMRAEENAGYGAIFPTPPLATSFDPRPLATSVDRANGLRRETEDSHETEEEASYAMSPSSSSSDEPPSRRIRPRSRPRLPPKPHLGPTKHSRGPSALSREASASLAEAESQRTSFLSTESGKRSVPSLKDAPNPYETQLDPVTRARLVSRPPVEEGAYSLELRGDATLRGPSASSREASSHGHGSEGPPLSSLRYDDVAATAGPFPPQAPGPSVAEERQNADEDVSDSAFEWDD